MCMQNEMHVYNGITKDYACAKVTQLTVNMVQLMCATIVLHRKVLCTTVTVINYLQLRSRRWLSSWFIYVHRYSTWPKRIENADRYYTDSANTQKIFIYNTYKWMRFEAIILHCKAILGQGKSGLVRWIFVWIIPQVDLHYRCSYWKSPVSEMTPRNRILRNSVASTSQILGTLNLYETP